MESEILIQSFENWWWLAYVLIFIGMLIEGEVIIFAAFFLATQNYVYLPAILLVVFAGAILGDILWYYGGHFLERIQFAHSLFCKVTYPLDRVIKRHPRTVIVLTKFTYGLHRVVLLKTRRGGIGFREFMKVDIPGSILWISTLASLAVLFSSYLGVLASKVKHVEIAVALVIIAFLVSVHTISFLFKLYLSKEEKEKCVDKN